MGAVALPLASLLAACGGSADQPTAPPASSGSGDSATQPAASGNGAASTGGRITVSHAGTPRMLDPAKQNFGDEWNLAANIFDTLTIWNYDGTIQPLLAESWETSDDLKTWTFYLQKGVKFHNGQDLTANDVKATIEHVLDPATGSPLRTPLQTIESIDVVDEHTVRFNLATPYGELDGVLTNVAASISPADKIETQAQEPIGTGPFKLKEIMHGDHVTLVKNENYWRPGLPKLDEVIFKEIPEPATRVTSIQNNETDIFWYVPFDLVEQLRSSPGIVIDESTTNGFDVLVMHVEKEPFNDPRVRQAIRLACNKQELLQLCLQGHGEQVVLPLRPSDPFYPDHVADWEQDYETAKQLLAEAGYPDGFETPMYIGLGRPARERMAEIIADMLKPLNIRCNIQRMPIDKFFAEVEFHGEFYTTGFFSAPAPHMHLAPHFVTGGHWNVYHYSNPEVDRLFEEAKATRSDEEKKRLYGEITEIVIRGDGPNMIPWVTTYINAIRDHVQGFRSYPDFYLRLAEVSVAKA